MTGDASKSTDLDLAMNALRDCAFLARNLRPRSRRALDYIERFANERIVRLGGEPSTIKRDVIILTRQLRRTASAKA